MAFLQLNDYRTAITTRDLQALTALDDPSPELAAVPEDEDDDDDDQQPDPTPPPAPVMSIRFEAEDRAMREVASYLRGRYDIDAAFATRGAVRNAQLVGVVVDVAVWHLSGRVAFANVSEIREIKYNAAIAWLKLCQAGKSNPDLPAYTANPAKPQARLRFRYGSNPKRSNFF